MPSIEYQAFRKDKGEKPKTVLSIRSFHIAATGYSVAAVSPHPFTGLDNVCVGHWVENKPKKSEIGELIDFVPGKGEIALRRHGFFPLGR